MRVNADTRNGRLTLRIETEPGDVARAPRKLRSYYGRGKPAIGGPGGSMRLARQTCTFDLPGRWTLDDVHPDVLALAIALLVFPFARTRLRVPRGVSREFAHVFEHLTGLR